MTGRLAILCPGQGGQNPSMFDLGGRGTALDITARAALDKVLALPLAAVLADESLLFLNRLAQPLIVAATLSAWDAVKASIPAPYLVAGYSVGELAAHAVAGTIAPDDAIALAAERARLMDGCVAPNAPHGMMAVSGLPFGAMRAALDRSGLFVAIANGEDSFIVGGLEWSLTAVSPVLTQLGAQLTPLRIGIASHTPLLQAASLAFSKAIGNYRLSNPRIPVLAGISGDKVRDKEQVAAILSAQIAQTVRWMDCMDALGENGITVALELGPGAALSRMLKARHPHIESRSVADFRSVAGVAQWVGRHL